MSERSPSASLRILQFLAPGDFGGLETVVKSLASGLASLGHTVTVAAQTAKGERPSGFIDPLRDEGIDVEVYEGERHRYDREVRWLRGLVARNQPDVIQCHGSHADVVGVAVARALGVPVVATVHGVIPGGLQHRTLLRLDWFSLRFADAAVAVSQPLGDEMIRRGVRAKQVRVIPNGFKARSELVAREEARNALGIASGKFAIGWIGRLSSEKGPDIFIDALARLGDPGVEAIVIGDGREESALKAQVDVLGLGKAVRFAGRLLNAASLIRAFDLVVLSSRSEGTPMVLLEALDAGVPVVATAVGGVPGVMAGSAGLVSNVSADAIADAMRSAIAGTLQCEMQLPEAYSLTRWLGAYETLFRELVPAR